MRIQRLDLIRYGKFTDKQVDLPRAPRDFHFVVGLNEAGKSTLRDAIQALFWGIPPRSPLDFVHPKNELRVGAKIEHDGQTVEFQRAKGNRQTLRDTRDAVLPDNALAAFLGTTDASFFEKMFSLDHTRLEAGGQSILDSDDDASQVLFQASAGIASLGKVRDELARQADALWAPRKSGDRAYYQAADQLERATALLKSVVVRTKDWAEAHDKVEALTASAAGERDRHEGTSKQRSVLERVRRVAPGLRELRNVEAALAALEEVVDLPVGAMAAVDSADQDLARAQEVRNLRSTEVDRLDTSLKDLHLDVAILPLGADIEDLNAKRLTYSNYPRDLEKRTTEVNMAWETVQAAMAQLRWNEPDENAVRQRMPPLDKRKSLDELVKSNGRIEEAARSTRQNADAKKLDVESLTKQLAELPETAIPVALTKAQNRALKLGDIEATHLRIARDLTNAQANTATAFQRLDVWTRPSAESAQPTPSSPTRRRSKISSCRKSKMSKKRRRN